MTENLNKAIVQKAKKRTWKTIAGIGLNAAGGALVTNPNIYILLAGVICMGLGSALLAWDDGEEVQKSEQNKQKKYLENNLKELKKEDEKTEAYIKNIEEN